VTGGPELPDGEAETPPDRPKLRALAEAALFVSPAPVRLADLARALGEPVETVRDLLQEMADEFDRPEHGLWLRVVGGGYRLTTKPEHRADLRAVLEDLPPPAPLSRAAIETAAAIALKQPATAAEVMQMRGVANADPIRTLLRRKLIAPAGRAKSRGAPLRYRTTRRFLIEFGLRDLKELRHVDSLQHRPELRDAGDPE
jgi:segregation and condensation protein B